VSGEHLLIRASAGTGKTFRLTHRALALLAAHESPERLLASTFTRKAAGEIGRRLLARAAAAALDEGERAKVNAQLLSEPGGLQLDEAGARELALTLLRQLHRLQVRTLDAFFAQLARVHAWELDLPPGWTVAGNVDIARLQADAVTRVLSRADRRQVLALVSTLAGGAPKSSVHADLLIKLRDAHQTYLDAEPAAWTAIGEPEGPPAAAIEQACAALSAFATPLTKDGRPRANWVKALTAACAAVTARDWEAFRDTGLAKKVAAGEGSYDRVALEPALCATLRTLLAAGAAADLRREARRLQAWHGLLQQYHTAFAELQRERRLLRFEDVPRALQVAGLPADEATLALRLDGALRHVLLDEFQDTSTLQWRVLRPLLDRALADPARHVFAVGDPKQSIYGWRSGEPRLMEVLRGRGLELDEMARSQRSAPAVMRAVNRVFERLPQSPVFAGDEVLAEVARTWHGAESFPRHETARTELCGAVRLWEVPMPDKSRVDEQRLRVAAATAGLIARLSAADPGLRIGVLVQRRKRIPRLLHELRGRGVLASGEGGNHLTDSDAVLVLLSLLRLADHPGDSVAAFHVGTSPVAECLGVDFGETASWTRAALAARRELLARGYGAWIAARQADVEACASFGAWDRRRVAQLVELGHAWDARATLRPGDFVDFVRSTPVEDPAAARVRVLTVHAAKGLEFDAVVCPDLDQDPARFGERGLVSARRDAEQDLDRVFVSVPRELAEQAGHRPLLALLDDVRSRDVREDLCELYVALTRAKRRVDLIAAGAGPPALSFASILRAALAPPPVEDAGEEDESETADEAAGPGESAAEDQKPAELVLLDEEVDDGLDPWLAPEPEPAAASAMAAVTPAAAPPPRARWRAGPSAHVLRRVAPSSREGGGRRRPRELLSLATPVARARGAVLHAWMQQLAWIEDPLPADELLLASARRLLHRTGAAPDERLLREWLASWHAMLERPRLRAALGRPAGPPPKLWREHRFLVLDEEQGARVLVPGAFDRAVIRADGAEILDFKTDAVGTPEAPDAARLQQRAAHYAPQMQAYRRALAALTGLAPASIACRLLFLEADEIRDVPP
jgi:ATP-dependent helicase/nuclease subunit A